VLTHPVRDDDGHASQRARPCIQRCYIYNRQEKDPALGHRQRNGESVCCARLSLSLCTDWEDARVIYDFDNGCKTLPIVDRKVPRPEAQLQLPFARLIRAVEGPVELSQRAPLVCRN
jgi:hypothetical protein